MKTENILLSLKLMKWITNQLVCDDGCRRRNLCAKISSLGGYKAQSALIDHFMMCKPARGSQEPVKELDLLYVAAVQEAPSELMELYIFQKKTRPLSERWDRTYNG